MADSKKKTKRKPHSGNFKARPIGKSIGEKGEEIRKEVVRPNESKSDETIVEPLIPELFQETRKATYTAAAVDKWKHDVGILMTEWAVKYPLLSPRKWLIEIKGYTDYQAKQIMDFSGSDTSWVTEKNKILDKMTETMIKRHVDIMAEVQDTHIKASKVGLAKAVEMLSKMQIEPLVDSAGRFVKDPTTGKVLYKGFRSIDLLNCLGAIEKAQNIYRKAMGLPNEEGGLQQILNKMNEIGPAVEQHLHIHEAPSGPESKGEELARRMDTEMSYDDIQTLIKIYRENKKRQSESQTIETEKVDDNGSSQNGSG